MGGSDTANLRVVLIGLALVVSPPVCLGQSGEVMLDLTGPGSRQRSLLLINFRVEDFESLTDCQLGALAGRGKHIDHFSNLSVKVNSIFWIEYAVFHLSEGTWAEQLLRQLTERHTNIVVEEC